MFSNGVFVINIGSACKHAVKTYLTAVTIHELLESVAELDISRFDGWELRFVGWLRCIITNIGAHATASAFFVSCRHSCFCNVDNLKLQLLAP